MANSIFGNGIKSRNEIKKMARLFRNGSYKNDELQLCNNSEAKARRDWQGEVKSRKKEEDVSPGWAIHLPFFSVILLAGMFGWPG